MAICYPKIEQDDIRYVYISPWNAKMGGIHSISLPRGVSCPDDVPCKNKCIMRYVEGRPAVRNTYNLNYECWESDPDWYFDSIKADCMGQRYFRWHVCGDIPSAEYFEEMIAVAKETPSCVHLAFTKQYDIVNLILDKGVKLPDNMVVIFSRWDGYACDNRHHLPESWVDFHNKELPDYVLRKGRKCSGNCSECNIRQNGCFQMRRGDIVILSGK